jgi:hypothetical protein
MHTNAKADAVVEIARACGVSPDPRPASCPVGPVSRALDFLTSRPTRSAPAAGTNKVATKRATPNVPPITAPTLATLVGLAKALGVQLHGLFTEKWAKADYLPGRAPVHSAAT